MLALSDLVRKNTLLVYHLLRQADYFEQSPDIEAYYAIVIFANRRLEQTLWNTT